MKICYIFREKERKAHSIELLFDKISENVKRCGIEVEKWYKPQSHFKAILSLRKLKADVYHITGDCYYLSLFLPWKKTIMTIHDIGMYKNHSKTLKRRFFVFVSFILPMKVLKLSTVISDLTKCDLIEMLKVNPCKLKVIPNPMVLPIKYTPKVFNQEKPNILQIGTGVHKNLIGLIEAVKDIPCRLEIIGTPDQHLIDKMNEYKIDYFISANISNEDVIEKYKQCDILYFASLSEGFGLPILEAQAMGRLVVTSNTEPTKSVCGEGGICVNPNSYTEINIAIRKLRDQKELRESLIINGMENVKRYDIAKIVFQYISLYRKLQ